MKKKIIRGRWGKCIIVFAALLCFGWIISSGHAEECPEPKKEVTLANTITLDTPEGVKSMQPAVTFNHLDHAMEYGCGACHHKWEPGNDASPAKCFDCHSNTEERASEDSYFGAFHNRQAETSCLGCHMNVIQDDDTLEAPLMCNECHIRN